ncbi:MAG: hypothetical protein NC433_16680 [Clostridiales bacterium]|nr:hypothetical protein [Clostridiales bacterium]
MMKKYGVIALIAIMMIVLIAYGKQKSGERPFKDLETSEIVSATVYLEQENKTIKINDIDELTDYLNALIIYDEDSSYKEYSGSATVFNLTMTDSTQMSIVTYMPFLIIDGVGYQAEYEPCYALARYVINLLYKE